MKKTDPQNRWQPQCKAGNCQQPARTTGYCPRHYQQLRRWGRLTPEREYRRREGRCQAEQCREPQVAKGYCGRHYQQLRRYGRLIPERERLWHNT
jgi:hypothetical protein